MNAIISHAERTHKAACISCYSCFALPRRGYDEIVASSGSVNTTMVFKALEGFAGNSQRKPAVTPEDAVAEMIDFYNPATANYFPYKMKGFPEQAPMAC